MIKCDFISAPGPAEVVEVEEVEEARDLFVRERERERESFIMIGSEVKTHQ